jgi:hypothetical protein
MVKAAFIRIEKLRCGSAALRRYFDDCAPWNKQKAPKVCLAEYEDLKEASMCDYSLHFVPTRPAKVADKLVTTKFNVSTTRGFAEVGEPNVAVCVRPGTEIAFESEVEYYDVWGVSPCYKVRQKVARFYQINGDEARAHHDALEFPDGQIILLTRLCEGQHATVLQLLATLPPPTNAVDERTSNSVAAYSNGDHGRSEALVPMAFPLGPDDRA